MMTKEECAAALARLDDIRDDVRNHCTDNSFLKLENVRQSLDAAAQAADPADGTAVAGMTVEAVADALALRIGGEVAAAVGEAFAAQQPAAGA